MKTRDKAIMGILIAAIIVIFVGGLAKNEKEAFSTDKWVNYTGDSRQLILDDFVNKNTVTGMTKDEVQATLGKADTAGETVWIYYVGVPQGLFAKGEEAEYLVFTFADGVVEQLENVTESNLQPYLDAAAAQPETEEAVEEEPVDPNAPVDTLITME
ncbi:hypothetical protein H9X85_05385 [Anaerotignum lactatifermentans]|uniref:Lipoprotein SmpA/OmlA domain-containing protein n=1 Tax=Anaerotignum lactatifermentans TaxID=160404 RepID=A0ABS2G9I1_9FIRM|nr:hypothetical protein [Anaerotignum lactatifermentans]MBM6829120.1 hypothetical protein [Anaerotignum lactatifermentans]MBM6877272.1 hypothetical protein [Anaerotignum lactatifermentans]MBM6950645.1 hypothetical protein [Anaerotignum lactatifermentans]